MPKKKKDPLNNSALIVQKNDSEWALTPKEILARKCIDPLDVMEILKISRTTLNNLCTAGILIEIKMGHRVYYDMDDIIASINKCKRSRKKTA